MYDFYRGGFLLSDDTYVAQKKILTSKQPYVLYAHVSTTRRVRNRGGFGSLSRGRQYLSVYTQLTCRMLLYMHFSTKLNIF